VTLRLNGSTSGYTEIDAPAVAGSNTITLPTGNGSANQLLKNGSTAGSLGWSSMVEDSSGRVGIGTTTVDYLLDARGPSGSAIQLANTSDSNRGVQLKVTGTSGGTVALNTTSAVYGLTFGIDSVEKARIDISGRLLVGTSTADGMGGITIGNDASAGAKQILFNRASTTGTSYPLDFRNNGTVVGAIAYSNTSTTYATSSDYRLKENVIAVTDGITRLQQLKPSRFNFIVDPDHTVDGFIAHEAQAIVPECVTGDKDAVDADGNPIYQGIDQSKLVPLLTAALQEAIGRIETLEAEVAALKGA
jgi:hypothetical protein